MVSVLRSLFSAVIAPSLGFGRSRKSDGDHKIGAYTVDYSEPTQAEIDAANASCQELAKDDNWVPVNRKS
jgi:hypothetical protein